MPWIIAGVIVLILIIWYISSYNRFVTLKNKIEEAFSTMDVYLKKRYDLIPNLVETVKGYAKHESGTLEAVIKARNLAMSAGSTEERAQGDNMLSGTLKSLFALAESYPDLKANQNFLDLQNQLKAIEADIANARKYYNAVVRDYNTLRETFPSVIVANLNHMEKKTLFVIENEERQNVKVQF